MQAILSSIDTITLNFSSAWDQEKMPGWMQKLHTDYKDLNKSAQFFILKLIINRPKVFYPYANEWFVYLAEYVTSKDTGGKGLHYFLRDICSILVSFSDNIDLSKDNTKRLCNEIVSNYFCNQQDFLN